MSVQARISALGMALGIVAAACGGAATAPTPTAAATTAPASVTPTSAPASAAPATAVPTASGSPAPAYAGVGSASTKLSEVTFAAKTAPVHVTFLGDQAGLAAGNYTETMNLVTLQPGGRTVSHKHGGLEIVFITEGAVEINMGAAGRVTLKAGETAKVPANTPLQALNTGTVVAKFLAFFMTLEGQPFQTNLETVP